jgi:peptidoglycan L-alanyl-D-glutamate endopeptidase CwlK
MDSISESRLALVHPLLAKKVRAMAEVLAAEGIYIRVVQGLRTAAQQDELYAQGRTEPGPKVTNACGGYSSHNFGMAVDLIPGVRGVDPWKPNWSAASPDYKAMIAAGEAQGLVSGSRWKSMPDMPHFQLAGVPVTPTDGMRAALTQGLAHVWNTYAPENV